jgi:DHA2 family multidrug resistance protein
VLAFDTAFAALAALFVIAAPLLIATSIGLSRQARARVARSS